MVSVSLVQSLRLSPNQGSMVSVKVEGAENFDQPMMLEQREGLAGMTVEDSLITCTKEGYAHVLIMNRSDTTQRAPRGAEVGHAEAVDVVNALQNRDEGPEDSETSEKLRQ